MRWRLLASLSGCRTPVQRFRVIIVLLALGLYVPRNT